MSKIRVWDSAANADKTYCPVLISNGSLATLLDFHGDQQQNINYSTYGAFGSGSVGNSSFKQMPACMYREGVRRNTVGRDLIPLGHFEEEINGVWQEPVRARQSIDLDCGLVTCENEYASHFSAVTQAFMHKQDPIFMLRKQVPDHLPYTLRYYYSEPYSKEQVSWSQLNIQQEADDRGVICSWKTAGQHGDYTGTIGLLCSEACSVSTEGCCVVFHFDHAPGRIDFAFVYTDCCYEKRTVSLENGTTETVVYHEEENRRLREKASRAGFDGLMQEQIALWQAFWNTFTIELPDKNLQDTFETAIFTLESSFTKWSIPVSINNAAWRGNFFAFNLFTEIYCATGHAEKAKRIPAYRKAILPAANRRANGHHTEEARYIWLCDEEGIWDSSIPGIWYDHIFHLGNITEEAWNCYLYTNDKKFLEETCYPIMRGCANFFLNQAVYTTADGRTIIGSYCDLERIGRMVKNAMLTTCSAIGTLEWTAAAAHVLGVDEELAQKWLDTAKALRVALPNDGTKYIPYGGAEEKSIGALGGFHPYPVLTKDDPLEQEALRDFCADTSRGNMYNVGNGLCTWYAAWVAISLFRSERTAEGIQYLYHAFQKTGAFNAVFEINEPGAFVSFPWCSAPNASFAQALIQMLVWWDYGKDTLHIGSGFPSDWKDMKFSLHAPDDLTVHYERTDGVITKLTLTAGASTKGMFRQVLWEGNTTPVTLRPNETVELV